MNFRIFEKPKEKGGNNEGQKESLDKKKRQYYDLVSDIEEKRKQCLLTEYSNENILIHFEKRDDSYFNSLSENGLNDGITKLVGLIKEQVEILKDSDLVAALEEDSIKKEKLGEKNDITKRVIYSAENFLIKNGVDYDLMFPEVNVGDDGKVTMVYTENLTIGSSKIKSGFEKIKENQGKLLEDLKIGLKENKNQKEFNELLKDAFFDGKKKLSDASKKVVEGWMQDEERKDCFYDVKDLNIKFEELNKNNPLTHKVVFTIEFDIKKNLPERQLEAA